MTLSLLVLAPFGHVLGFSLMNWDAIWGSAWIAKQIDESQYNISREEERKSETVRDSEREREKKNRERDERTSRGKETSTTCIGHIRARVAL